MIRGTAVVTAVERLCPTFVRVELGGEDLRDFGVDGPTFDQRIKLLFGDAMRTYTIREVRPGPRLVVDFVLHLEPGASGPAAAWAATAAPGDTVGIIAPRAGEVFGGIEWAPGGASRLLLAGDETAVPAISAILEQLPPDARGAAYLEVPCAQDLLPLRAPRGVDVRWLARDGRPHGSLLAPAVRGCSLLRGYPPIRVSPHLLTPARPNKCGDAPTGPPSSAHAGAATDEVDPDLWETPAYSSSGEELPEGAGTTGELYAWIAGEAGVVTGLRRHLVRELGLDRRQVAFMGYWRQGRQHA